jgi:hypothetical protein
MPSQPKVYLHGTIVFRRFRCREVKMAVIINRRANIVWLVFGAALWSPLAGCTGSLVYRPEKKPEPVIVAVKAVKGNLPPEPDKKANDATLAGIDTTGIGIRDDVHIMIYTNYSSTKKRTIIVTMAKALQGVMVNTPRTKEDAKKLEQSYNDAVLMLKDVHGLKPSEADDMDRFVYTRIVNTPERLKAYLQYNLLLREGKATH